MRRRQDRPAAANRRRLRAPGAGTLRRRSGQSRDWRQSGAWTGRRPTAAARRGSCAWVISVGPSPLLSKKERSPADSRITQRRSSRPSTALLPWSPSTGTGGRHPPETVVPSNRKPRSPWTGARSAAPRRLPPAVPAPQRASFPVPHGVRTWANTRSRLRSRRTKATNAASVLRAFARQGHLVGIVTGSRSAQARQGSSVAHFLPPQNRLAPEGARMALLSRSCMLPRFRRDDDATGLPREAHHVNAAIIVLPAAYRGRNTLGRARTLLRRQFLASGFRKTQRRIVLGAREEQA